MAKKGGSENSTFTGLMKKRTDLGPTCMDYQVNRSSRNISLSSASE